MRRHTLAIVNGKVRQFAILTLAAEYQKSSNQDETEEYQDQKRDQQINHGGRQSIIAAVACDKLGEHVNHRRVIERMADGNLIR